MMSVSKLGALIALLCAGCAQYSWKPSVPEDARTVSVAVFRNSSDVTELGSAVTRGILREFQREGTYSIASRDDAALEVQGEIKSAKSGQVAYERKTGARSREYRFAVTAVVSFIDRRTGKVLVDSRRYTADTTFLANDDILGGERDASGRLADELARRIVDDAVSLEW